MILDKPASVATAEVLLGTYGENSAPSAVTFDLYRGDRHLAHAELPPEAIHDNRYSVFDFKQDVPLVEGNYRYVVSMTAPGSPKRLSAWAFETAGGETYQVGNTTFPGAPKLYLTSKSSLRQTLAVSSAEPGIDIVENRVVTGSGYFVNTLAGRPDADYGSVHLAAYRPDDVLLRYDGKAPGFVVLPFRTNENWRATLDGAPVELDQFVGLFPAVKVNGPSMVRYFYDTGPLLMKLGISLAGFAVSIFAIVLLG